MARGVEVQTEVHTAGSSCSSRYFLGRRQCLVEQFDQHRQVLREVRLKSLDLLESFVAFFSDSMLV